MKKLFFSFIAIIVIGSFVSCGTKASENQLNKGTKKVGQFEVTLFSDTEFTSSTSILLGLTPEMQKKYLNDSTFVIPINSFLLKTPSQNMLVDAGLGLKMEENLKQANLQPSDIATILITHLHSDHIKGLLKNDTALFANAKVYLPASDTVFILNDELMNSLPEDFKASFMLARKVLKVYSKQIVYFTPNEVDSVKKSQVIEGVYAIAAPGHTPGHTAFLLESDNERLLIWGDLAHCMAVQMPRPEVAVIYDDNAGMAQQSRSKLLGYVVANKLNIAGMHIASPAMGSVESDGNGGYVFTPITQ